MTQMCVLDINDMGGRGEGQLTSCSFSSQSLLLLNNVIGRHLQFRLAMSALFLISKKRVPFCSFVRTPSSPFLYHHVPENKLQAIGSHRLFHLKPEPKKS